MSNFPSQGIYPAQQSGYMDANGNWIQGPGTTTTTTGGLDSGFSTLYQAADPRDVDLMRLRLELAAKETALREAYCEIGRLHEQLRGLTAFDKWSGDLASQQGQDKK